MPQRLLRHIQEHPTRLIVTSMAVLLASLALLGFALYINIHSNHTAADKAREAAIANCIAINELRRQLYTASLDLGVERSVAVRFLPHRSCEVLP